MTTTLADKHCEPCRGGVPPMKEADARAMLDQLDSAWELVENHHIAREYRFRNFRQGLDFVNRVGEIAETEGHHPDITLSWGKVGVTLFTHKIDGLTESDFILAAKCDDAYAE